jgi:hypothetical protein
MRHFAHPSAVVAQPAETGTGTRTPAAPWAGNVRQPLRQILR